MLDDSRLKNSEILEVCLIKLRSEQKDFKIISELNRRGTSTSENSPEQEMVLPHEKYLLRDHETTNRRF